jgi:hypothetical protein
LCRLRSSDKDRIPKRRRILGVSNSRLGGENWSRAAARNKSEGETREAFIVA